jgi:hypothetical protein
MSAGMPAGSGRSMRLDPFALPVRYKTGDPGADERERIIEIDRERVIVRRSVHGIPMKLSMQVSEYLGVAIRVVPPRGEFDGAIAVTLEHRDKGLSVPLFVAPDGGDISVEWQTWARVLGLPALVEDADGELRDPFGPLGRIDAGDTTPHRLGRATMRKRRGYGRLRRKPGVNDAEKTPVYQGERELIARD